MYILKIPLVYLTIEVIIKMSVRSHFKALIKYSHVLISEHSFLVQVSCSEILSLAQLVVLCGACLHSFRGATGQFLGPFFELGSIFLFHNRRLFISRLSGVEP